MTKFFKGLAKKLVISILTTALSIFILYWNVMNIITAFQTPNADWSQVWTYLIWSIVVLAVMWLISFLKFLKNLIFVILVLILVGWWYFGNTMTNMCVTMGTCKAGTEIKTVSGKVIIDQHSCVSNGWSWDTQKNVCKTKVKK